MAAMKFSGDAVHPTQLFLMNEVVLNLDPMRAAAPVRPRGFRALSFNAVLRMGQELYAEHPLLHFARPEGARRLATLLSAKAPSINSALFVAPGFACSAEEVTVRLASTSLELMLDLYERQCAGVLDAVHTDRQVWRRLAA